MGEHRISDYLLNIAKKTNKSLDREKIEIVRQKMFKKSIPFLVVGGTIMIISIILTFSLLNTIDRSVLQYITYAAILGSGIILAVGIFFYRTSKQMYFGAELLDSLNESGKKCPKCGMSCGDTAGFCEKCGAKLLKSKICADCGLQNEEDAKYCIKCGKKLNASANAIDGSAKCFYQDDKE